MKHFPHFSVLPRYYLTIEAFPQKSLCSEKTVPSIISPGVKSSGFWMKTYLSLWWPPKWKLDFPKDVIEAEVDQSSASESGFPAEVVADKLVSSFSVVQVCHGDNRNFVNVFVVAEVWNALKSGTFSKWLPKTMIGGAITHEWVVLSQHYISPNF